MTVFCLVWQCLGAKAARAGEVLSLSAARRPAPWRGVRGVVSRLSAPSGLRAPASARAAAGQIEFRNFTSQSRSSCRKASIWTLSRSRTSHLSRTHITDLSRLTVTLSPHACRRLPSPSRTPGTRLSPLARRRGSTREIVSAAGAGGGGSSGGSTRYGCVQPTVQRVRLYSYTQETGKTHVHCTGLLHAMARSRLQLSSPSHITVPLKRRVYKET